MALSGNVSAGDPVKGSKDVASFVACTRKKFFGWGVRIFCEWHHKWRTFRPPWPTSPDPGRQPLDVSISLNCQTTAKGSEICASTSIDVAILLAIVNLTKMCITVCSRDLILFGSRVCSETYTPHTSQLSIGICIWEYWQCSRKNASSPLGLKLLQTRKIWAMNWSYTGMDQTSVNLTALSCRNKTSTLTFWHPVGFGDSCAKTSGSHVALRARNLGTENGRELFKGSKDASLLVCTQKKFFGWGVLIFCKWCHKWKAFRTPWPTSPGHGPKLFYGSILLKFLLETRLQSESLILWMTCWGFGFKSYDLK